MLRRVVIGGVLLALLVSGARAQEPKPKSPPPVGPGAPGPRAGGFGRGPFGPPGERVNGPAALNSLFGSGRATVGGAVLDAERELRKFDRNGDDRLDRAEWPASWPEASRMDANGDGSITIPELEAYSADLNARSRDLRGRDGPGFRPGMGPRANELETMRQ